MQYLDQHGLDTLWAKIRGTFQAQTTNLTNLLGASGTGFLKKGANNTWTIDTNTYLTQNQSITLSGDVSGSGRTSISVTIGEGKVTNDMLAGSIANSKLTNSKVTIAGTDVSLGGSIIAATLRSNLGLGTVYDRNYTTSVSTNTDATVPTSKAVKAYVDAAVAGASNYLGTVSKVADLSTTAKKGDFYRVATAWTGVHVGDILIAEQNNPAAAIITSGTNGYTCLHNEINTDTTYTLSTGTDNGNITVTPSVGGAYQVAVKGWSGKQDKIDDVSDSGSGWVSAVTQTNGKIAVTKTSFVTPTVTFGGTTTNAPTITIKDSMGNSSSATSIPLATGSVTGLVSSTTQTFGGVKTFANTTESTSSSTGAVKVSGGLGVAKNINSGSNISAQGGVSAKGFVDLNMTSTGGGVGNISQIRQWTEYDSSSDEQVLGANLGVELKDNKADKVNLNAGTAGTSSATSGATIAIPYVTMNSQGIVAGYGTHNHTLGSLATKSSLAFRELTGKPTTISGYGITDAKLDITTEEYSIITAFELTIGSNVVTVGAIPDSVINSLS